MANQSAGHQWRLCRIGAAYSALSYQNLADDIKIVGINDLPEPDHLAHMLQYDYVQHGRLLAATLSSMATTRH